MHVCIVGGLGYIGTACIFQMQQEPSIDRITVLDEAFVPSVISQLPPKVKFIQAKMEHAPLFRDVLQQSDAVILLAALTQAEQSGSREEAVWKVNFEDTKQVIQNCHPRARIVFASTANVFGGVAQDHARNLALIETDTPSPRLPYASSKVAMEKFIRENVDNWTLLRFGTNFGYSLGMRFNIVTNIFMRRALIGEDLVLYGGGLNWRPNCHVQDIAKSILHSIQSESMNRHLYHVARHNMTIKSLAETIVAERSKSAIITDDRTIPFNSYGIDSSLLESTGFSFGWTLEDGVSDMWDRFQSLASNA